jgi:hypothetical protein
MPTNAARTIISNLASPVEEWPMSREGMQTYRRFKPPDQPFLPPQPLINRNQFSYLKPVSEIAEKPCRTPSLFQHFEAGRARPALNTDGHRDAR